MPSATYSTASEEETVELGRHLAQTLPRGVVLLTGNLGAGKTTLAKGIVSGAGAARPDDVASPTFTLIHDYGEVVHIDLYRLETEREVEGLGLDEIIDRAKLTLIEWGERFPELFPNATTITIETTSPETRQIKVLT
jgi:tRNA threonylcarbamoyladenosine biosynthesis protein TsaE